jgi:CheY-like chemotaxis protein
MARILSVSYDEALLRTRQLILEERKHQVTSALGFTDALQHCQKATNFQLFILGHSIPSADKEALIETFRANCPAPILALKRHGEAPVRGADFEIEPQPQALLDLVSKITSGQGNAA